MAAAKAERGLAFFTFKDEKLQRGLDMTYRLLVRRGTTVGECSAEVHIWSLLSSDQLIFGITLFTEELFHLLEDYCAVQNASGASNVELFDFIRTNLPSKSQL